MKSSRHTPCAVRSFLTEGYVFRVLKSVLAHLTSYDPEGYGTRSVPATLPVAGVGHGRVLLPYFAIAYRLFLSAINRTLFDSVGVE